MSDVGLDLQPLLKVEVPLAMERFSASLVEKIGLEAPVHVRVRVRCDLQDPLEGPFGEDGGLVRLQDEGKLIVHLGQFALHLFVQGRQLFLGLGTQRQGQRELPQEAFPLSTAFLTNLKRALTISRSGS